MQTDFLFIGAGVATTAVITKILSEKPDAAITVLEAGTKVKMRDYALYHNYMITGKLPFDNQTIYDSTYDLPYGDRDKEGENVSVGDTQIPLNGGRAFLYGGSTVHWGGWSFRLKPEDFHLRTNLLQQGAEPYDTLDWPFTYDELEPWYTEAEHFIGVSGDSDDITVRRSGKYPYPAYPYTIEDGLFIKAFNKFTQPIPYSHLPIARYGATQENVNHGPCHTTGLCKYCPFGARFVAGNNLDDLVNSALYPNLRIITNVVAQQILMDAKDHASGVAYFDKTKGTNETITANTVIIASGAIEGPKLLLRSQPSFYPNGIGNDNDLVGRFLITHPYFFFKATLPDNPQMLQPEMGFPTLVTRHFDSVEDQAKGKFIMLNPPSSPKANLARAMGSGKTRDEIVQAIKQNVTVQIQGIIEVFSEHGNRVMNLDLPNRFGMPQTKIEFNKNKGFDDRMKEVGDIAADIFSKMGAVNPGTEIPISWRADHAACTTRMSNDPQDGVVDADLKIHGISNLYVCSNSSFASLGAVNPTLTLAALSLRLGDHLVKQSNTKHTAYYEPSTNFSFR